MFDFSKHKLQEALALDAEAKASENAMASVDKKKDPNHTVRQKNQSAAKMGTAQKSNVVYASEDYFSELNRTKEIYKAQEKARVDWRADLAEAKEKDGPEDEGTHPYVSVMPHADSQEKQQKKQVEKEKQKEKFQMPEEVLYERSDEQVGKELDARQRAFNKQSRRGHAETEKKKILGLKRELFKRSGAPSQKEAIAKRREEYMAKRKSEKKESVDHFDIFARFVDESALNPFQYHPNKGGTDKGTKAQAAKIAKNIADNRKKGPMKYDPMNDTKGT